MIVRETKQKKSGNEADKKASPW